MQTSIAPLIGIPGTEATSSKRGYYYQDVVTAVAWTRLGVGQELHVEIAEDYAIAAEAEVQVTQVKDLAASLTLVNGIEYLERALRITEENPHRNISFVYLTTSFVGTEKDLKYRPEGKAGILYWQDVQAGADPSPLISILKKLAPAKSRLAAFLATKTESEILHKLLQRVAWAVRAPESGSLKDELKERVAKIAHDECRLELVLGRRLWPAVLDAVTDLSTNPVESQRVLTYEGLRQLVRDESTVTLTKRRYESLLDEAELAKNPPIVQVNNDVRRRLDLLRQSRFLQEALAVDGASALGRDVADGGVCQIGDQRLRATALSWCARILLEEHPSLADEFLANAERLAKVPEQALVKALIVAKRDKDEARRLIASDVTGAAETIRYAIARQGSTTAGLSWLADMNVEAAELDQGGQFLVLWDLLMAQRWADAVNWFEKVPDISLNEFPALQWAGAHALVAWATADVAQGAALAGPPIVSEIPLRDDVPALAARRHAVELFRSFHPTAEAWGLKATAELALEYALWLMLEDRTSRPAAVAEISRLWGESDASSRWMPMAIRAGLDIDKDNLAAKLDRHAARYGSLSMDDARARLSLVLATPAEKWIDVWPAIQSSIAAHFTTAFLQHIHIQGLIHLGRVGDAREALSGAAEIPEMARQRFEIELGGADQRTIKDYRDAVERDGSPASLHNLVAALVKAGSFADASAFALKMYEQTREHGNAEEYLRILRRQGRWGEILGFLDEHEFLLEQSSILSRMHVDALIRYGRWRQARDVADKYLDLGSDRAELDLQLAVSSGQWDDVGRLLENAFSNADLQGEEMTRFAGIATNLGNVSLAKRFVKRATHEFSGDPAICWTAYMLAVQGNWEDEPEVRQWFDVAMASANAEGSPVRSGSISELMELAPKWREQTNELEKSIASADMFLALAAQQINRPLASVIVGAAISNESEQDFRRISPIPIYAGVARRIPDSRPRSVVLDATAMLTLAHLNLLERALEFFATIHVPHSTGVWLFSETSRVRFHQPGKIADARKILHAVARRELRISDSSLGFSKRLGDEVGADLAQLLSSCREDRNSGRQAFVVRSTPLHRVGSFLEEQADVGECQEMFRSTVEVMRSLLTYGGISDQHYDEAIAYLGHVDNGWPNEGPIPTGSILYLDDLSVTYLQHVGVLKALADSKFDLVVHADVHTQAVALNALEEANETVGEVLDGIRRFFVDGQAKEVVRVLPLPARDGASDSDEGHQPKEVTASLLLSQMFEHVDGIQAVVFDDRGANRHPEFTYSGGTGVPLFTTIDVVDWMLEEKCIEERDWLRCRTVLRRSGCLFVPLESKELLVALGGSTVHEGELVESLAARAIRENLLLAQASGMLRLPDEGMWLAEFANQILEAVTKLWSSDEHDAAVTVKASWLVELSRYDGFADRMLGANEELRWVSLDALTIHRFLMNLHVPKDRRAAYNRWLDETYLSDMPQAKPRVFASLCEMVRRNLIGMSAAVEDDDGTVKLSPSERDVAVAMIGKEFINHLPQAIQDVIFDDDELFKTLGLSRSIIIRANIEGAPAFSADDLYSAAAMAYEDGSTQIVQDTLGVEWSIVLDERRFALCVDTRGGRKFPVAHSKLVSPNVSERVDYARVYASNVGIAERHIESWIAELTVAPLTASQIQQLERDFQNCPAWRMIHISKLLDEGNIAAADVAPTNRDYYLRLVTQWSGQASLGDFAALLGGVEVEGVEGHTLWRLILSSHQWTTPISKIKEMSPDALRNEVLAVLENADLWSLVGLIEAMSAREDAFSELLDITTLAIDTFRSAITDDARIGLTSALVSLVDATVNVSGIWADAPVYWRRLASIAQAALVERAVLSSSVDLRSFVDWADNSFALFQAACLADMNREPRWSGFMLHASQLRQELIGRALGALESRRDDISSGTLGDAVFGEHEDSLHSRRSLLLSALPGPLEGAVNLEQHLPEQFVALLESSLEDEGQPLFRRVLAAAQLADMGALPEAVITKLAGAVRELDKSDLTSDASDNVAIFCMMLSLAAAANRSDELAGATKQLILSQPSILLSVRLYAGISACAAESEASKWAAVVGHVMTRCTSMVESRQDAEYVLFVLRAMCDVRSDLRPSVSKAYAQLQALRLRLV